MKKALVVVVLLLVSTIVVFVPMLAHHQVDAPTKTVETSPFPDVCREAFQNRFDHPKDFEPFGSPVYSRQYMKCFRPEGRILGWVWLPIDCAAVCNQLAPSVRGLAGCDAGGY